MKIQPFVIDNSHLYWQQQKWDGYNGKWMDHVRIVMYEITRQRNETREDSREFPTMNHALLFFSTIHLERINTKNQLENNKRIQLLKESIKKIKPKKLKSINLSTVLISNTFNQLTSDSDSEPENEEQKDLYDKPEIVKLSEYIHKVLMASLTGHALQALKEYWFLKNPDGFDTVARIIDVFGQKPEFTLLTPFTYQWSSQIDPREDWDQFKLLIDGDQYLTDHPSAETTVIQCARKGLSKTNNGKKAIDQVRASLGSRPESWEKFKNTVDRPN